MGVISTCIVSLKGFARFFAGHVYIYIIKYNYVYIYIHVGFYTWKHACIVLRTLPPLSLPIYIYTYLNLNTEVPIYASFYVPLSIFPSIHVQLHKCLPTY